MSTTLAQCGRTLLNHLGDRIIALDLLTQGFAYRIWRKLAVTLKRTVQTAMNRHSLPQETLQLLLHNRISLFQHQDLLTLANDLLDLLSRKRILGDLQYGMLETVRIILGKIIESDTRRDDTQVFIRGIEILIICGILGSFRESLLRRQQTLETFTGQCRE